MIVVTGEIELHPEDAWPALSVALRMMEASATEDGCVTYRFYSDLVNPRRLRLYEEWRDEAALAAHFKTPHMVEFQKAISNLRIISRSIKQFEVEESKPL